jgi:hypothetical protein
VSNVTAANAVSYWAFVAGEFSLISPGAKIPGQVTPSRARQPTRG